MKGEVSKSEDACLAHLGVSQVKVSKPGSPCAVLPTLSIPDDPVERVQANKRDAHKVFDAGASTATRSLARTRPHAETPHAPLPPVPFTPSQGVRTPGSVPITKQMFTPFSSSTVHAEVQNHMAQTSSSVPHRSNSSRSVAPAPSPAAHSATSNQQHSEATSDYSHATHMAHMQTHMPYQPYMMYPLGSMAYPDAGSSPMRPPSPLMGSPVSTPTASYMFPQTPFAGAHHSPFSQFHSSSFTGPGHGYGHGGEPSMSPQNSGHYSYFHPLFNNFPPFMGLQSMGSMQGPGAHLPLQTMRSNSSSAVLQVGGAGFGQAGIGGERGGPGGGGQGLPGGPRRAPSTRLPSDVAWLPIFTPQAPPIPPPPLGRKPSATPGASGRQAEAATAAGLDARPGVGRAGEGEEGMAVHGSAAGGPWNMFSPQHGSGGQGVTAQRYGSMQYLPIDFYLAAAAAVPGLPGQGFPPPPHGSNGMLAEDDGGEGGCGESQQGGLPNPGDPMRHSSSGDADAYPSMLSPQPGMEGGGAQDPGAGLGSKPRPAPPPQHQPAYHPAFHPTAHGWQASMHSPSMPGPGMVAPPGMAGIPPYDAAFYEQAYGLALLGVPGMAGVAAGLMPGQPERLPPQGPVHGMQGGMRMGSPTGQARRRLASDPQPGRLPGPPPPPHPSMPFHAAYPGGYDVMEMFERGRAGQGAPPPQMHRSSSRVGFASPGHAGPPGYAGATTQPQLAAALAMQQMHMYMAAGGGAAGHPHPMGPPPPPHAMILGMGAPGGYTMHPYMLAMAAAAAGGVHPPDSMHSMQPPPPPGRPSGAHASMAGAGYGGPAAMHPGGAGGRGQAMHHSPHPGAYPQPGAAGTPSPGGYARLPGRRSPGGMLGCSPGLGVGGPDSAGKLVAPGSGPGSGTPNSLPRLNARQRRTLRRAKERAIKGLMEAGHLLLMRQLSPDAAATAAAAAATAVGEAGAPGGKAVGQVGGAGRGEEGPGAAKAEELDRQRVLSPAGALRPDARGPQDRTELSRDTASSSCAAPDSSPSPGTAAAADSSDAPMSYYIHAAMQVAGGSHGPQAAADASQVLSKVAADLEDMDLGELITQLSHKREEGVVEDALIRDLQIIHNLVGAFKIPLASLPQPQTSAAAAAAAAISAAGGEAGATQGGASGATRELGSTGQAFSHHPALPSPPPPPSSSHFKQRQVASLSATNYPPQPAQPPPSLPPPPRGGLSRQAAAAAPPHTTAWHSPPPPLAPSAAPTLMSTVQPPCPPTSVTPAAGLLSPPSPPQGRPGPGMLVQLTARGETAASTGLLLPGKGQQAGSSATGLIVGSMEGKGEQQHLGQGQRPGSQPGPASHAQLLRDGEVRGVKNNPAAEQPPGLRGSGGGVVIPMSASSAAAKVAAPV